MNSLRQAVHEYVDMRRNLGFKLTDDAPALLDFVTYLEDRAALYITNELAVDWAQQRTRAAPPVWATRLNFVRQFARYRSATDPRTQVPPRSLLPFKPKRARPYLYSDQEIKRLLQAALNLGYRYPSGALRPRLFHCLLGLLAVTGLRLGEVIGLELRDVDLGARVLTVRSGKFGKDRLVPLHASTTKVLADYIERRRLHWAGKPVPTSLFLSSWGNCINASDIHMTFYMLSRRIGLRGPNDRYGPRLHDFRHRFATHTLVRWYRADRDPERMLPILAAYLGHTCYTDTQWYLSGSPELMREAMRRLERRWEGRP
jgi:integrase/recombinase XerD